MPIDSSPHTHHRPPPQVGRFLLREYVTTTFVDEYVWLRAVGRVLQEKPWSSNLLLRLSIIPAAIKSYGLGALQAPALPFALSALVCQAALSYVLTDMGAGLKDPSDLFKAESKGSQVRLDGLQLQLFFRDL